MRPHYSSCFPRRESPRSRSSWTKTGETAENLEMVENVLADIQANGALSALPVAVSGIGYGGFIAGHLLARKNCFAAGAIISGLTNPATAYGTCKGITLSQNAISDDFSMMDYLSRLTKESVVYHCDDIHTPLLLLHGFHDEIYGFEQAEQLFTSVKERQPQSEIRMVVFPTGDVIWLKILTAKRNTLKNSSVGS